MISSGTLPTRIFFDQIEFWPSKVACEPPGVPIGGESDFLLELAEKVQNYNIEGETLSGPKNYNIIWLESRWRTDRTLTSVTRIDTNSNFEFGQKHTVFPRTVNLSPKVTHKHTSPPLSPWGRLRDLRTPK